jgi:hypothetical protein
MGFSAIILVENLDSANAELAAKGYGESNFSVPLRAAGEPQASHAALNMLGDFPEFKAAVEALPGVSIQEAPEGEVAFDSHVQSQALEWSDPTNWTENPIMTGDQRTFEGKLWVSLVDYNVWTPPTNWREVPQDGYPAWTQPTGATDAYAIGDRVRHNDKNWESNTAANVWEPGVFGWDEIT